MVLFYVNYEIALLELDFINWYDIRNRCGWNPFHPEKVSARHSLLTDSFHRLRGPVTQRNALFDCCLSFSMLWWVHLSPTVTKRCKIHKVSGWSTQSDTTDFPQVCFRGQLAIETYGPCGAMRSRSRALSISNRSTECPELFLFFQVYRLRLPRKFGTNPFRYIRLLDWASSVGTGEGVLW